jgi:hypothetical protein
MVLVLGLSGCGGGGGGASGSTAPTINLGGTGTATQLDGSVVTTTTNTDGQINGNVAANAVGTAVCAQCHSDFPYSNHYAAGNPVDANPTSSTYYDATANASVYTNYVNSVHWSPRPGAASGGSTDNVQCEGCHGPGSQHYGTGPIPFYAPGVAQCQTCHSGSGPSLTAQAVIDAPLFNATAHANSGASPDQFFSQGSTGTAQALFFGQAARPQYQDVAGTVPVNQNQAIEECSVCHSPDTQAAHIAKGDVPNPPQVGCASCHDPHRPAEVNPNYLAGLGQASGTPVDPSTQVNFKPVRVNNNPLGNQFGANNLNGGTWVRPRMYYPYNAGGNPATTYVGYTTQTTMGVDSLRLSPERLCAACHTAGQYKYTQRAGSTAVTATHNQDIFTQYEHSLHAANNNDPWKLFSLLATDPSHRPQYPYDMGGKSGQNGTTVPFDGRINGGADNFACYQCHNGIGTIDYINGTQGGRALGDSNQAHVLWGDSTATCITCHDPHKSGTATSKNVRQPKYLSYNPEFQPRYSPSGSGNARGGANTFLDLTPIPSGIGNDIICMFCHQGRESGWTAWNKVRRNRLGQGDGASAAADFWYASPNLPINAAKGFSFVNDHYLAAGPMTYGRNSTEFAGQLYSDGIPAHQQQGCTGCHMSNPDAAATVGGHTFRPTVTTCQQCHAGVNDFHSIAASGDWNGDGKTETVFAKIGTLNIIPAKSAGGPGHGAPIYGSGQGGSGLMGLLNEALWDAGMEFDPNVYPYFYKADAAHDGASANAFNAFTPNTLAAAQDLCQLYRSGSPTQQPIYVHNPYYCAQILQDSLGVLGHTVGADGVTPFVRPPVAQGGTSHLGRDYRTLNVP